MAQSCQKSWQSNLHRFSNWTLMRVKRCPVLLFYNQSMASDDEKMAKLIDTLQIYCTKVCAITHLPMMFMPSDLPWELVAIEWNSFASYIPNHNILQECFKVCEWLSLQCLRSRINELTTRPQYVGLFYILFIYSFIYYYSLYFLFIHYLFFLFGGEGGLTELG